MPDFCSNCAAPLDTDSKFCSLCGATVSTSATPAPGLDTSAGNHAKWGRRQRLGIVSGVLLILLGWFLVAWQRELTVAFGGGRSIGGGIIIGFDSAMESTIAGFGALAIVAGIATLAVIYVRKDK